ncbi:MAG TPA: zinc ribbon domain-containing protein [Polyangiaceae bacterium]|jgi:hypothetical protein
MTERKPRKRRAAAPAPQPSRASDDSERSLGRAVAFGLPAVALLGALVVGAFGSLGSALLVVAAGALLGAISLLWASIRTLSGDAPLPAGLEGMSTHRGPVDDLAEEKWRVLRALKDLEAEHAIGKIDDADYAVVVETYRADAKRLMREMDEGLAPLRDEAEKLAQEYVAKRRDRAAKGDDADAKATTSVAAGDGGSDAAPVPGGDVAPAIPRAACSGCGASNEPDAAFCKKCGARMGSADANDAKLDETDGDDAAR